MNWKLAAGVLVALFGVAVAAWVGVTQLGGARTVRSAGASGEQAGGELPAGAVNRSIDQTGGPPAWVEDSAIADDDSFAFKKASSPEQALGVLDDQVDSFTQTVADNTELGSLRGAPRLGLVESWRAFVGPLLAGDEAGFVAAVGELGGVTEAGEDGKSPAGTLYERLVVFFEGSSLDLSRARVRRADADDPGDVPSLPPMPDGMDMPEGAIPMMIAVTQSVGDADPEMATTGRAVMIPLAGVFEGVDTLASKGAPVVEVWSPAKLRKSKVAGADLGAALFFVWDKKLRRWRPMALRVTLASERSQGLLPQMPRGGGRP